MPMKLPMTQTLIVHLLSLANSTTNRNKPVSVALTTEVKATSAFFTMVGIFS
jgi:hypothetical protein